LREKRIFGIIFAFINKKLPLQKRGSEKSMSKIKFATPKFNLPLAFSVFSRGDKEKEGKSHADPNHEGNPAIKNLNKSHFVAFLSSIALNGRYIDNSLPIRAGSDSRMVAFGEIARAATPAKNNPLARSINNSESFSNCPPVNFTKNQLNISNNFLLSRDL